MIPKVSGVLNNSGFNLGILTIEQTLSDLAIIEELNLLDDEDNDVYRHYQLLKRLFANYYGIENISFPWKAVVKFLKNHSFYAKQLIFAPIFRAFVVEKQKESSELFPSLNALEKIQPDGRYEPIQESTLVALFFKPLGIMIKSYKRLVVNEGEAPSYQNLEGTQPNEDNKFAEAEYPYADGNRPIIAIYGDNHHYELQPLDGKELEEATKEYLQEIENLPPGLKAFHDYLSGSVTGEGTIEALEKARKAVSEMLKKQLDEPANSEGIEFPLDGAPELPEPADSKLKEVLAALAKRNKQHSDILKRLENGEDVTMEEVNKLHLGTDFFLGGAKRPSHSAPHTEPQMFIPPKEPTDSTLGTGGSGPDSSNKQDDAPVPRVSPQGDDEDSKVFTPPPPKVPDYSRLGRCDVNAAIPDVIIFVHNLLCAIQIQEPDKEAEVKILRDHIFHLEDQTNSMTPLASYLRDKLCCALSQSASMDKPDLHTSDISEAVAEIEAFNHATRTIDQRFNQPSNRPLIKAAQKTIDKAWEVYIKTKDKDLITVIQQTQLLAIDPKQEHIERYEVLRKQLDGKGSWGKIIAGLMIYMIGMALAAAGLTLPFLSLGTAATVAAGSAVIGLGLFRAGMNKGLYRDAKEVSTEAKKCLR